MTSIHIEEGGVDHSSSNCKTLVIVEFKQMSALGAVVSHHAELAQSVEDLRRHLTKSTLKIWGKCEKELFLMRLKLFSLLPVKLLFLPPLPTLILPLLPSQPV